MQKTLIRSGFVASQDPEIGNQEQLDVLIEGTTIAAVGRDIEAGDAHIVDAGDCIVMPGFVDAHRHIWQGALRGVCADWSIMDYLSRIRLNAARFFTADDMYIAQLQGGLEALNAGVTTVTDYCHNLLTPDHAFEAIRGLKESGMRAVWNYGFNFPPAEAPHFRSLQQRLAFLDEIAKRDFSSADSLLTLGVAPEEAMFAGSPQVLDQQIKAARTVGARLFWHANAPADTPPREVAGLYERGMLSSDMTFVHMAGTEQDEWQMLSDHGASVVFTPDTELQMGMRWPSSATAKEFGVNQAYGTDIVSNNSADMFTTLRVGLQGLRGHLLEAEGQMQSGVPITCEEVLKWGTIDAARALGMETVVGSITPGKRADILMLKGDSMTLTGWDRTNVAGAIVFHAQSTDVDTVWVNGEIVKQNGKLKMDIRPVSSQLQAASTGLHARIEATGGFALSPEQVQGRLLAVAGSEHGQYDFEKETASSV